LLAQDLGYVGFAADIYGPNDHVVEDIARRRELATLYRSNVTLFVQRIKAAVNTVKSLDGVDVDNVAVIGYCFGGTGVLVRCTAMSRMLIFSRHLTNASWFKGLRLDWPR